MGFELLVLGTLAGCANARISTMNLFRNYGRGNGRPGTFRFHDLGRRVLIAIALLISLGLPALAALTGDLQGTVLDPNGALVEGAKITIRHRGTGVVRTAMSDSRGEYAALQLEVGSYEVKIEK